MIDLRVILGIAEAVRAHEKGGMERISSEDAARKYGQQMKDGFFYNSERFVAVIHMATPGDMQVIFDYDDKISIYDVDLYAMRVEHVL